MKWEISFLRWVVEKTQTPIITFIFKLLTLTGEMAVLFFIIAIIMVVFKKTRKAGLIIIFGLILVSGFNLWIFKPLVNRPRPFDVPHVSEDALWLNNYMYNVFAVQSKFNDFLVPSSLAFMSGHTLSAFIFGFTILIHHRKWAVPALILSVLMSYTRIYFGFHYPTDVFAGIVTALATVLLFTWIANKHEAWFIKVWRKFIGLFQKKSKKDHAPVEKADAENQE
ncbi:MAG: Undecaprenyl-diphosphatase BcrC [Tenericutes bacterium ADurb.Bin239]|jgi:undecaprenyl-diphosphatase|nr:MAG: Undecaprenyl-diphosphatase BcrC [Tenericutes bacterium ADurb.Bin239]